MNHVWSGDVTAVLCQALFHGCQRISLCGFHFNRRDVVLGSDSAFRYEKIYLHSVFGIALVVFREEAYRIFFFSYYTIPRLLEHSILHHSAIIDVAKVQHLSRYSKYLSFNNVNRNFVFCLFNILSILNPTNIL